MKDNEKCGQCRFFVPKIAEDNKGECKISGKNHDGRKSAATAAAVNLNKSEMVRWGLPHRFVILQKLLCQYQQSLQNHCLYHKIILLYIGDTLIMANLQPAEPIHA
ncbi:MAG: hypothetical protein ACYTBX_06025 [Planctomycetota bacterium]